MSDDISDEIIEKFWNSVEKTENGCWNWKGFIRKQFPILKIKKKEISARKLSTLINGKTIKGQLKPLICRNNLCVNPEHLVSGDQARFWARVQKMSDPNGCWVWTGYLNPGGYGTFSIYDTKVITLLAHHYSWQEYTGRPVPIGIFLCHTCDHRYCVNPHHLFLGTHKDNMDDMISKGRSSTKEKHWNAKLNESDINFIRTSTLKNIDLGIMFGVRAAHIGRIKNKRRWK